MMDRASSPAAGINDALEVHDFYLLIVTLDERRYTQIIAANIVVLMEPTAAHDIVRQQISCSQVLYVAYITCLFALCQLAFLIYSLPLSPPLLPASLVPEFTHSPT